MSEASEGKKENKIDIEPSKLRLSKGIQQK